MSVKSVQANLFLGPDARSWRYPPKDALMLVLGFVAIAAVSCAAGWFVGTVLTEHVRLI
jgi:putative Mn2+ efflux pump MntP